MFPGDVVTLAPNVYNTTGDFNRTAGVGFVYFLKETHGTIRCKGDRRDCVFDGGGEYAVFLISIGSKSVLFRGFTFR